MAEPKDVAQEAIRLSEEQFRKAIQEAPIPTIMQAEDGQVLQISRSWTELTGYKLADIPTFDRWLTSVVYDDTHAVRDQMNELFKGSKRSVNVNFSVCTHDKGVRDWSFSASSPGTLIDGRRFIIGMAVDITERKKAEEAFLKSKELIEAQRKRLETILETSPSAIVILEAPNGKISYINKRALELYGFDTVKLNLLEHIAAVKARKLNGSEYPAWEVPAAKALKGQVVRNEELIIKQANGKEIPVVVSAAPIYNKDNVASAIAIFEDITERKKTEQVLRKSEEKIKEYANNLEKIVAERTKELKESERLAAIGATAGMVGHDIRNPLQAIVGDIYLLSDVLLDLPEGKMKQEVRESLENIGANINYINKIVADLQDYARPITPEIKTLNLYELVTTCFGPIEIPDEIKLYLDIDVSLWLRTDETLLRRIISNLVTNALQAMPNEGSLSIKASQSEDVILVTIEDTVWVYLSRLSPSCLHL